MRGHRRLNRWRAWRRSTRRSLQRGATSVAQRGQLDAALDFVREGDTLIMTRLDRLARSTADLLGIVALLERKEVALRILDFDGITCTESAGEPTIAENYTPGDTCVDPVHSSTLRHLQNIWRVLRSIPARRASRPRGRPPPYLSLALHDRLHGRRSLR